jgi:hypothetical protein
VPDFDAFRGKLNAKLGQHAPPYIEWVNKLEAYCNAQDRKIAELDEELSRAGNKDEQIKDLEQELAHLTEDILDMDRGIKDPEELIADARHRT